MHSVLSPLALYIQEHTGPWSTTVCRMGSRRTRLPYTNHPTLWALPRQAAA